MIVIGVEQAEPSVWHARVSDGETPIMESWLYSISTLANLLDGFDPVAVVVARGPDYQRSYRLRELWPEKVWVGVEETLSSTSTLSTEIGEVRVVRKQGEDDLTMWCRAARECAADA